MGAPRDSGRDERAAWTFRIGTALVGAGVFLSLPMFIGARGDHYVLNGMPWDTWMIVGMILAAVGLVLALWRVGRGLVGRAEVRSAERPVEVALTTPQRLRPAHVSLMAVLTLAVAIDSQKPFTFTFILPGVAKEYGLSSPAHPVPGHLPVALLPFAGILGTVVGSLLLGYIADRVGRRATVLAAATLFVATAACGAMPSFGWNVAMCFAMGIGVGGLLPIAYSLLTEVLPDRYRGQAIVLVAGVGTACGFLLASWAAHWLIPVFGWRIMWFLGLPSGLVLVALSRYVQESPRFLLACGRNEEAQSVMRAFGMRVDERQPARIDARTVSGGETHHLRHLFSGRLRPITLALGLCGLAWGLVNFGFLVWLPVNIAHLGVASSQVTAILAKAALFSVPAALVVAWLYGRWSSKWTLVASAAVMTAALIAFVPLSHDAARHTGLLTLLVVLLLTAMWATISVLLPYCAELYPTAVRGAGGGVTAGASKLGGVLALTMAVAAISPPSLAGAALAAAVPSVIAVVAVVAIGIETRGRRLEEIASRVGGEAV